MWLFLMFLGIPLIEIALFIQIGGAIGLELVLLIVVITAILGTYLVRTQGIMALDKLRSSFSELQDPSEPLAHGAMILFAGALLFTPGFFTDSIGFALMVPHVRQAAFTWLRKRVHVQSFGHSTHQQSHQQSVRPDIIDGEYEDVSTENRRSGPSEWTKH